MPVTGTAAEVKTGGPLQEKSSGANASKVMVPVGSDPPIMVAVSEIVSPSVASGVAAVVSVGVAAVTSVVSPCSPQNEKARELLSSPE